MSHESKSRSINSKGKQGICMSECVSECVCMRCVRDYMGVCGCVFYIGLFFVCIVYKLSSLNCVTKLKLICILIRVC